MSNSSWESCLRFINGSLLLVDQVVNILYFIRRRGHFFSSGVEGAFLSTLTALPVINLAIAMYCLYPEYRENMVLQATQLEPYLRTELYNPAKKVGRFLTMTKERCTIIIAILLGIFVAFGFAMWSLGVLIIMSFVHFTAVCTLVVEVFVWICFSLFLSLIIYSRFFHCVHPNVVLQCMASGNRSIFSNQNKIVTFVMVLTLAQLFVQTTPCLIIKVLNEILSPPHGKARVLTIVLTGVTLVVEVFSIYIMRRNVIKMRIRNPAESQSIVINIES